MTATIAKSSPRYSTWIDIFGTDSIRVTGPPFIGPHGQPLILVDITALNTRQLQRLAIKFSRAWRLPSERVGKEIVYRGTAEISAVDVTVVEEARLF
jgi:hypothetical protein